MSNKLLRALAQKNKLINFTPLAISPNFDKSRRNFKEEEKQYNYYKYGRATAVTLLGFSLFASKNTAKGRDYGALYPPPPFSWPFYPENPHFPFQIYVKISDPVNLRQEDSEDEYINTATIQKVVMKAPISNEAGEKIPGLPIYSAEEVSKHDKKDDFWVTYKHGVYNVTKFLNSHPGGDQIYNAAGLSIQPFWNVYGMHHTPAVHKLLETYRIGNLRDEDVVDQSDQEIWVKEPARDLRLIVKTLRPFNAEVPPHLQVDTFYTPNEVFYVRQHMPVPELDASSHKVTVSVTVGKRNERQLSLTDLQQYPRVKLIAAIMCAGNRRSEMHKVKEVKGLAWSGGAISNAEWSGVALRDVLLDCGVTDCDLEGKHVIFEGADIDAMGHNFSTSIPLRMAMNPDSCVVLATHMNGRPLPPDHGYPIRVVVPGAPAVRSAKWLDKIIISDQESSGHWHKRDYRSFNPSTTWETADWDAAPPVYSLPVTSAICDPLDGDTVTVENDRITVRGYAYSGGGAEVLRVDVSTDCGVTWQQAALTKHPAPPRRHYAWTLWTANLPLSNSGKQVQIWVKATDSNFNTQPEKFNDIWNIRGILSNAYHKITVNLDQGKK